jgi:hypothetical protein
MEETTHQLQVIMPSIFSGMLTMNHTTIATAVHANVCGWNNRDQNLPHAFCSSNRISHHHTGTNKLSIGKEITYSRSLLLLLFRNTPFRDIADVLLAIKVIERIRFCCNG